MIPTSVAVDVARLVAESEGYSLADSRRSFFDLMLDKMGGPVFPGYVTLGFYVSGHLVNSISINERTGQVLDIEHCTMFEYPKLWSFQNEISRATGARALGEAELRSPGACPTLTRLRTPKHSPKR